MPARWRMLAAVTRIEWQVQLARDLSLGLRWNTACAERRRKLWTWPAVMYLKEEPGEADAYTATGEVEGTLREIARRQMRRAARTGQTSGRS